MNNRHLAHLFRPSRELKAARRVAKGPPKEGEVEDGLVAAYRELFAKTPGKFLELLRKMEGEFRDEKSKIALEHGAVKDEGTERCLEVAERLIREYTQKGV